MSVTSPVAGRVRDLFMYGSLNKRVFASPDLADEVQEVVDDVYGGRGITVEVPETWTEHEYRPGRTGILVAWDIDMDHPDVA